MSEFKLAFAQPEWDVNVYHIRYQTNNLKHMIRHHVAYLASLKKIDWCKKSAIEEYKSRFHLSISYLAFSRVPWLNCIVETLSQYCSILHSISKSSKTRDFFSLEICTSTFLLLIILKHCKLRHPMVIATKAGFFCLCPAVVSTFSKT